jgi:hypothetical protein
MAEISSARICFKNLVAFLFEIEDFFGVREIFLVQFSSFSSLRFELLTLCNFIDKAKLSKLF